METTDTRGNLNGKRSDTALPQSSDIRRMPFKPLPSYDATSHTEASFYENSSMKFKTGISPASVLEKKKPGIISSLRPNETVKTGAVGATFPHTENLMMILQQRRAHCTALFHRQQK